MLNLLEFLLNYIRMPCSRLHFSSRAIRCASEPHAEQSLWITHKPPPLNSMIMLWNHCPQEVMLTPLVITLPSTHLIIIFHLTPVPPFPHASLSLSSPRLDFPSGEYTSHSPCSLQLQCFICLTWPPCLNSDLTRRPWTFNTTFNILTNNCRDISCTLWRRHASASLITIT